MTNVRHSSMPSACQSVKPVETIVAPRYPWCPGLVTLKKERKETHKFPFFLFCTTGNGYRNRKKRIFSSCMDTNSWNPFVTDYFLVTVYGIKREKETGLVINPLPFYWNFFLSEFVQCSSLEEKNVAKDRHNWNSCMSPSRRGYLPPNQLFFPPPHPSIHPRDNWGAGVV